MAGCNDSSGDIGCDAVLTKEGRKRLAKGDGSFKITKFAFADDEIDYALYDKDHSDGTPYYDITVLQSPTLEAFTDGKIALKSKLLSINDPTILYMPMMKLYLGGTDGLAEEGSTTKHASSGAFVVVVDKTTADNLKSTSLGVIRGDRIGANNAHIRVDQGLNTSLLSNQEVLDPTFVENQWAIQVDNRLCRVAPPPSMTKSSRNSTRTSIPPARPSFVDNNNVATYFLGGGYVTNISGDDDSSILGPRGMQLAFRLAPSLSLSTSTSLFTKLGSTPSSAFTNSPPGNNLSAGAYQEINSTVTITGVNTHSTLSIPIKFIKSIV